MTERSRAGVSIVFASIHNKGTSIHNKGKTIAFSAKTAAEKAALTRLRRSIERGARTVVGRGIKGEDYFILNFSEDGR